MIERHEPVAGTTVRWSEAPARTSVPVVYVHGVPTDGDDWLPFLEQTGGYAPDLPGFGRSDKPPHFAYSIDGYADLLAAYVDQLELERFALVVHDWGVVGLALAQRIPDRIERIVVIDAVPLLPGYAWHRIARIWRTPLAGEFAMGLAFERTLRLISREFLAAPGPAPDALVERVWSHFDHGTQRAILKLYRSAPPAALEAAGARLGELRAPALIVWGEDDPYTPASFAGRFAERLGGPSTVELVTGARHWPWLDRPEIVARVTDFLGA